MKNECLPQHSPCEATACGFPHMPGKTSRPWHGCDARAQEAPKGEPFRDGVLRLDVHREQMVTHLSLPPFPLSPQLTALSALLSHHFLQGIPRDRGGPGCAEAPRRSSNRTDLVISACPAIFLFKGKNQQLQRVRNKGRMKQRGN